MASCHNFAHLFITLNFPLKISQNPRLVCVVKPISFQPLPWVVQMILDVKKVKKQNLFYFFISFLGTTLKNPKEELLGFAQSVCCYQVDGDEVKICGISQFRKFLLSGGDGFSLYTKEMHLFSLSSHFSVIANLECQTFTVCSVQNWCFLSWLKVAEFRMVRSKESLAPSVLNLDCWDGLMEGRYTEFHKPALSPWLFQTFKLLKQTHLKQDVFDEITGKIISDN